MEASIGLLEQIKREFECGEVDIRTFSPLTLAFVGDCIYDLVIRTVLVEKGNRSASSLHKQKSTMVKAEAQAQMMGVLLSELTLEEEAVYRRGRNAKSYTTAKNASVGDYRKATGFEALMGYLYLQNQSERMLILIKSGLEKIEKAL